MNHQSHDPTDPCLEALSYVHAFFAGEMSESDADRLRLHLDACEGCFESFEVERTITSLVQRANPACSAPEELRARILRLRIRST